MFRNKEAKVINNYRNIHTYIDCVLTVETHYKITRKLLNSRGLTTCLTNFIYT